MATQTTVGEAGSSTPWVDKFWALGCAFVFHSRSDRNSSESLHPNLHTRTHLHVGRQRCAYAGTSCRGVGERVRTLGDPNRFAKASSSVALNSAVGT